MAVVLKTQKVTPPIQRGEVRVIPFQFDPVVDITGRPFRFTVADVPNGTRVIVLEVGSGITITDGPAGKLDITFGDHTYSDSWDDLVATPKESARYLGGYVGDLFDITSGEERPVARLIIPVIDWAYEKTS